MQVNYADQGMETGDTRGGNRQHIILLEGDELSLDNYRLLVARQSGAYSGPRHRHNFDQIRMCLSGRMNYGVNQWIKPGEIAYFPEGTRYGPDISDEEYDSMVIQFGGSSGQGFLSSNQMIAGMEELKKFGKFEDGIFRRSGDIGPGERANQDSYEAIWEFLNARSIEYPKEHYEMPIHIKPQNFSWIPQPDLQALSVKQLAVLSERRVEISMLQILAHNSMRLTPRAGTQVGFVLSGTGRINDRELKERSAFSLEPFEAAQLTAISDLELVLMGLPILAATPVWPGSLALA